MAPHPSRPAPRRQSEDEAAQEAALQAEIARLKEAIGARADIDRAVGVLMAVARIPPAHALDALRETSRRTGTDLDRLVGLIVEWARTQSLPTTIRTELYRQMRCAPALAAGRQDCSADRTRSAPASS